VLPSPSRVDRSSNEVARRPARGAPRAGVAGGGWIDRPYRGLRRLRFGADAITSAQFDEKKKRLLELTAGSLKDEHTNKYDQAKWSNAIVEGQIRGQASLYTGKPVKEILVFEVPVRTAEWLTIMLPAVNFSEETEHVITLTIPTSAIRSRRVLRRRRSLRKETVPRTFC